MFLVPVVLDPISTVYIPYDYKSDETPKYGLNEDAIEQSAYDKINAVVYSVGKSSLFAFMPTAGCEPSNLKHLKATGH